MAEISIVEKLLPGVKRLEYPRYTDLRGDFTKLYHSDALKSINLPFNPAECFMTRSKAGVIRGMHYQEKEAAHDKLVCCLKGRVLDVIVDVRSDRPEFNKPVAIELCEADNTALLISKGYAHGFLSIEEDSWMMYATTTVHNPELDRGVLWSSINFEWPTTSPIISERDCKHPSIQTLR